MTLSQTPDTTPAASRSIGRIGRVARLLVREPGTFLRTLVGRPERYVTFVADPHQIAQPTAQPGWTVRKMSNESLYELPRDRDELRAQVERLSQGRLNDAYGLFIDDRLAVIAWMIPHEHDVMYGVRNVKLRPGEVEITHCVTLPEFRRRGGYTFLIRTLCCMARESGVQRVYMITNRQNHASQGGILKSGFAQVGGIYRHVFDFLGPTASITFRRHRWGPLGWN